MEPQAIEKEWNFYQQKAKRRWDRLTIAQLRAVDGKLDRLVDRIQVVYRLPRAVVEQEVYQWLDTFEGDGARESLGTLPRLRKVPGGVDLSERPSKTPR
jgi:hypothetical protein